MKLDQLEHFDFCSGNHLASVPFLGILIHILAWIWEQMWMPRSGQRLLVGCGLGSFLKNTLYSWYCSPYTPNPIPMHDKAMFLHYVHMR